MSSRNLHYIVHPALGGLDTTKAPALLDANQLVTADNIEYFTSGSRRKRPGTSRYNASTIAASTTVTSLGDFWRYGTSSTPTQKFVATAATQIYKDDGDGVWDSIKTGWGSNSANVSFMLGGGYVVWFDGTDAAQKWNQTTVSNLTGAADTYAGGTYHQRRGWYWPKASAPSTVQYSAASDITDVTGGDTGNIVFDEDDGDKVIGISTTWRGDIFVFKGPQFGSVHHLEGTSPTTYARSRLFSGAPCIAHQANITSPNDIFWASRYGFHSLIATDKFGDVEEAFISRPIQRIFNDLNRDRLPFARGFYHPTRNLVGWAVPEGGYQNNTVLFVYNFILGLWAVWRFTGFNIASIMTGLDPGGAGSGSPRLYIGGYDGFVREGDQIALTDDNGSAYTATIKTPLYVQFEGKDALTEAQFSGITTIFVPKGNYNVTLKVIVDGRQQDLTVNVAGGGAVLDSFVLDTDVLGGEIAYEYIDSPILDRGRSIQAEWSQGGAGQDMDILGYGFRYAPGELNAMEAA